MSARPLPLFLSLILFAAPLQAQVTLIDDLHRSVSLPSAAQRVVSLAPSVTETLFAVGAGDRVVGVTDYCNEPPAARRVPRVGGIINPNIETIVRLKPDLVILSMEGNVRDDFRRLTSLGVPVFVTNPRTIEDIYRSIGQIGSLTGMADSASRVVEFLRDRERAARAATGSTRVRALMVVSVQPLIVAGRNTFLHELLDAAGAVNLAAYAKGNYPTYSRETLIANNPDVIFVTSDVLADVGDLPRMFPEWRIVSALRHHRVFRVDADMMTRPGPRAVDALATLVHLLHPTP